MLERSIGTPEGQGGMVRYLKSRAIRSVSLREVVDANYSVYDFVRGSQSRNYGDVVLANVLSYRCGTGLYLQSLLEGYHLGGEVDQEKLLAYRKDLEQLSDEVLFEKIADLGKKIPEIIVVVPFVPWN